VWHSKETILFGEVSHLKSFLFDFCVLHEFRQGNCKTLGLRHVQTVIIFFDTKELQRIAAQQNDNGT